MEIPCDKCGHKSPMGAIFCRNCAEKLDVNNLKPEALRGGAGKAAGKAIGGVISKIVKVVVIVAILGLLIAFFMKAGDAVPAAPSNLEMVQKDSSKLFNRLYALEGYMSINKVSFENITSLSYAAQAELENLNQDSNDITLGLVPKSIIISSQGDDVFRVSLISDLRAKLGQRQIYAYADYKLISSETGISFETVAVMQGKIPLPAVAHPFVLNRLKAALVPTDKTLEAMIAQVEKVEIADDGAITIRFKKKEK